ncbi:MAG: fluoride efflux transporter CrcB [Gammaproteobacteria bacterium]|nr:fluoride efflux transporter CrcB [Gammaproteobacteria bacterium]|tara:strand:+ start:1378 stop:1842 length:465 start_codon:yes stop_codon:yes gene_type:complete
MILIKKLQKLHFYKIIKYIFYISENRLISYLWIGLGSALGGITRHWFSIFFDKLIVSSMPWGTILVNTLGCFAIGCFSYLISLDQKSLPVDFNSFLLIGFCGGFTTFSAFSMQSFNLIKNGEWLNMFGNIAISVIICLIAVFLGYFLTSVLKST